MSDLGPGQALFAFVRYWSRRAGERGSDQGNLVLVTEAVNTLSRHGTPATVNAVAHEIGIDQSGASRLIKAAAEAGYLTTRLASTDARRRDVSVTPPGAEMLEQAHGWQEEMFAQLTVGWSDRRRREFQAAMADLLRQSSGFD